MKTTLYFNNAAALETAAKLLWHNGIKHVLNTTSASISTMTEIPFEIQKQLAGYNENNLIVHKQDLNNPENFQHYEVVA